MNDLHFLESISSSLEICGSFRLKPGEAQQKEGRERCRCYLWKRTIDSRVSLLNIDDNRIIGVQYQIYKDNFVHIIQVYLPSANHALAHLMIIYLSCKIFVVCIKR